MPDTVICLEAEKKAMKKNQNKRPKNLKSKKGKKFIHVVVKEIRKIKDENLKEKSIQLQKLLLKSFNLSSEQKDFSGYKDFVGAFYNMLEDEDAQIFKELNELKKSIIKIFYDVNSLSRIDILD